ncbi:PREDICTED: synaptic vesicle glycoprotein 2B-like [Papilio xuthus]|uniref:Synaptic vesicle glycoprotein 2B-like n=1 Tax=Papilio xuthus TaxID=66420 RepID=A0AAJ6Z9R9_PAPXU|nr:PREDICTED: synaptic vesicle glycoprotein 2B-like [Papilio xuthus]XP_013167929.1 PREDICTED: synaptic vesicle glycoprotein 2B-like [Papilio xuthus]XP_013167936.1 PREDICTED: synaptic vesicle glycoprotein 2B-like [Papilio xuthus]
MGNITAQIKSVTDPESVARKKTEATFEDAVELTGHGKFNNFVLLTCGLILLNVSMESVGISYVITAAECELDLGSEHKGLLSASAFIGIVSTSFLWGFLGDRYGRRAVMTPAMLASVAFSLASSFATNVWTILVLRILTGCLVSASSATVYAYLGEMHVKSRRAAAIAWGSAFISFSFIILPGLAWLIIPGEWSWQWGWMTIAPWRVFMWFWGLPALVASAALLSLPESPRHVLATKGPDAALPILARMYAWNKGKTVDSFPVSKITASTTESCRSGFGEALRNISLMVRPPLARCVLISHVSMFAVFMLSSGLYMWVPDILNNILNSKSEQSITICQIIHNKFKAAQNVTHDAGYHYCRTDVSVGVFPISMGMGAMFAIVYLAIGFFIDKIGKKTLHCSILIFCGAATIGAAFVPQGGLATVLLVLSLCCGCAGSILAAIAVDVFPTCLRAMAMCLMYMVGRAGAAVGSNLLGATLDRHCQLAFTFLGIFTMCSTILMLFWPAPEHVRRKMEEKGLSY